MARKKRLRKRAQSPEGILAPQRALKIRTDRCNRARNRLPLRILMGSPRRPVGMTVSW